MADLPMFVFTLALILFIAYCAYIAFDLAKESKGFQRYCAAISFVILVGFDLFMIYGLATQDSNTATHQRK